MKLNSKEINNLKIELKELKKRLKYNNQKINEIKDSENIEIEENIKDYNFKYHQLNYYKIVKNYLETKIIETKRLLKEEKYENQFENITMSI